MEPDAEPASSPLSDVPSDFDTLNDGLDGTLEHGGPVKSTAEAEPNQDLDNSSLPSAPQELTTIQRQNDTIDRVVPVGQGNNGMKDGDHQKSSTAKQAALDGLGGDDQKSSTANRAAPDENEDDPKSSTVNRATLDECNGDDQRSSGAKRASPNEPDGDDKNSLEANQAVLDEVDGDEKQSIAKKHASDIPDVEPQARPARKRKLPKRYEDHLNSSPPHPRKEPKLCEEHPDSSPRRPTTKRQASTNDTHPLSDHHRDPPSLEAEAANNIPQCEAELHSTQEPVMDSESAGQSQALRPRRQRKAPKSYNEPGSDEEFVAEAPAKSKRTTSAGEKPKRVAPTWAPDYLLQDPKSRLGKANLTAILKDPRAWESLSKEQQIQLTQLLPNVPGLDLDPANVDSDCLYSIVHEFLNNSALLSDIAMFGEDLREGRLDPDWQRDGQAAMEMRARGDFDDWKVQEMEAFWGQKQKLQYDVLAGESSKIKLEELVREGTVQVGDVWVYKRNFPKDGAVVEKEAKVSCPERFALANTASLWAYTKTLTPP
ncbi:Asx homology domain-containing protein [Phyllosticta capitalensis]